MGDFVSGCSVARTSCAGGRRKQFGRNLSFLNSYVHSAELHNKQEFLHPSALKCRFSHRVVGYIFRQSCILRSLCQNSPILFFPRGARLYHTGSAGFLLWFIVRKTGRKAPRDDGWRTLDTNELALNTSLERCKCTWLVHSAIFFTDVHEKSAQQNVELVRRNFFQGSCLSN